ncbi:putative ADP-ribose pyrophosphatase [Cladorrhinum sp. PSN259]|nr:putative ADP-ribose pyrophosphatase [Cladorrhinum sp. PSN259]
MVSPIGAKVVSVKPLENADARWLNLVQIEYLTPDGKTRQWEAVRRTTKPQDSPADSVHIFAVRRNAANEPEILLEKQFRPPAGSVVIEFPAGLVDAGETLEECALRELKEETGYIGELIPGDAAPIIMWGSPASSSSRTVFINATVDLGRSENQNPVAELEETEFIEPFWVPLGKLHGELQKFAAEGFAIDSKVGVFAEGLEMAKLLQA